MRIGIDATSWMNGRGYGRFTRELLGAMAAAPRGHELLLFVEAQNAQSIRLDGPVRIVPVDQREAPTDAARAGGARGLFDMLRMTKAVKRAAPDITFFPTVYTYFPMPPRRRAVVGIHDAIAERFPELTFGDKRSQRFWNAKVRLAIWQSKRILTVSEFSKRDLIDVLGIDARRIRVVCEAASRTFTPSERSNEPAAAAARAGVPAGSPWFVYVGGFNPHKHVDVLVRAHAAVAAGCTEPPHLLLVGTTSGDVFHGDQGRIRKTIEECGTSSIVHWCGFVPDEELRHLHSGALACVLPSACEGFGLPAVEAARCGAPVVATTVSPLPEVLAGGGVFVEPGRAEPLADALRLMIDQPDERARMARTALARASALSWERAAAETLDVLEEAAS